MTVGFIVHNIFARLAPLLVFAFLIGTAGAQSQPSPNLAPGDAVVTGFSGTLPPPKALPRNKSAADVTFIDPDGASLRAFDASRPGFVWDGRLFDAPKKFEALAKDVGQVFGVALDDATPPNIYVAATSVFGLNLVSRGRDGAPERRKIGGPGAGWMRGQFGLDLQGGPGAIYRIDGRTGTPTLFANVTLDGVPNPAPGLGNLAYDADRKQLFVSDLYTGMIHRFDMTGKELGSFDHGVAGLGTAKLPTVAFNPRNRPNIASDRFDSEKPDTWGFAPAARRVWGLAVHEGRLYYSVLSGPQVWSIGLTRDGAFGDDPRWELDVPAQAGALPVTDIAFTQAGAMIVAQRAAVAAAYDYTAFTRPAEPQVLRFRLKGPDDLPTPGRWYPTPVEYPVGFAGNFRNSNGGVALGYGYGPDGIVNTGACEASLWITGQNLRNNPALRRELEPGGPLVVHGVQASPIDMVRRGSEPPAVSYFVDYDGTFDDPRASGQIGSVRIYTTPCPAGSYAAPTPVIMPVVIGGGGNVCTPTCVCPNGGVLKDGKCVERCDPPMVFNPRTGACGCPPGTALENGNCVRIWTIAPPKCVPPLVFDPVTGHCVMPPKCVPPLVLDPVTHTCICPQGTVMQDRKCVPQICPPPLVPGPCECSEGCTGSVNVKKEVTTHDTLIPWPNPGPLFPMTLTCTAPPQSWSFSLNNNGTYTANNIPFGKICTVAEGPMPPFPPNLCPRGTVPAWLPLPFTTPASVVINGTTVTMVVHNSVTCVKPGELTVTKKVSPDPRGIGNTLSFPMTVTCTNPNTSYTLTIPGNTSSVPHSVPVGSNCTVTETLPALPKGCTWLPPIFSPATVPIASGLNLETVTNGYTCRDLPIDLKVEKTGAPTPYCPAPYYGWTITVTNSGAGWPATGNVVVTDTVPANMTFDPINSPPWSCLPLGSHAAGTTFTCTYNGPAPTANQPLPPINITATATIGPPFPPYVNCTSVAITPSSGYVDSNPADNNFCTPPVMKPAACCPPPASLNAAGLCTCQPPQVMNVDGICVTPPICTAPQVLQPDGTCGCPAPTTPGAIPGQCICAAPNVMVNGVCTLPPPPICTPPQVLGPAGTTCICPPPTTPGAVLGQCICAAPNVMVGGVCVLPPPPACTPPQVLQPDGTCGCPAPMTPGAVLGQCICAAPNVMVGGACVLPPPPTCTPPQVPGPDGTCLCAAPNVMVNGKCTARKADEKKTEKKPEPCPEGTHRVGKRCVKNESKEPRIKTEDVIRGIDIMRGIGGGGGGGGRNPTGGGASPGGGGTKR